MNEDRSLKSEDRGRGERDGRAGLWDFSSLSVVEMTTDLRMELDK